MTRRQWRVGSWMANPFYALILEEERGILWWKHPVYVWRIHYYRGPSYQGDSFRTCKGRALTYALALAALNRDLFERGFRVVLGPHNTLD
jgi:hypothetical protein